MSAEYLPLFPRVARAALRRAPHIQPTLPGLEETLETSMEAKVARYLELKPLVKEYHQLDKEIKQFAGDSRAVKAGRFTLHPGATQVREKFVSAYTARRISISF